MSLKDNINQDIKKALLEGDSNRVSTLRTLKSVILYAEVEKGLRDKGLSDQLMMDLLNKEAKKRQESADLYTKGGEKERAQKELQEKAIIEAYLPPRLSDDRIKELINGALISLDKSPESLGKVIAIVKEKSNGAANGADIARLAKGILNQ